MNRVEVDHPAIKEMIFRRSNGDPRYVAGVRAFLTEGGKPPEGMIAGSGYRDAHDMTAYLAEILADVRADEWAEECRVSARRQGRSESVQPALETPAERSQLAREIKMKQSRAMRL